MSDKYRMAVPVISSSNVLETIAYFEKTLDFTRQWTWGEPPVYAGVRAGGAMLYICEDQEHALAIREQGLAPEIFVWVEDIDAVYQKHRAGQADIVEELTLRPWGVNQYVVREPGGYRLKFAESQESETNS